MVNVQPQTNAEFAEAAKRIRGARSLREMGRTTGISHTRISDMEFGVIPSYRLLERYLDAVQASVEQRREMFRLAGYDQSENDRVQEPAAEYDDAVPAERLVLGILRLNRQFSRPVPVDLQHQGEAILTGEGVDELLADLERQLREGII